MKSQPSSAIENGFDQPVDPDRRHDPAPVISHLSERGKVNFQQHRHDHQPDQHGDRQIDFRHCRSAERMEHAGHGLPKANADDNAKRDPERQEPLEFPHGRGFSCPVAVRDGYRFAHAPAFPPTAAPSMSSISLRRFVSESLSRLLIGMAVKTAILFFNRGTLG
jgi:hypothetical protein